MALGNGSSAQMIEAWASGVRQLAATTVNTADEAAIYRVSTTSTVKTNAVNFMLNQLGKPYDYSWLTYFGGKSVNSYYWYCSELAWAGYKVYGMEQIKAFHAERKESLADLAQKAENGEVSLDNFDIAANEINELYMQRCRAVLTEAQFLLIFGAGEGSTGDAEDSKATETPDASPSF